MWKKMKRVQESKTSWEMEGGYRGENGHKTDIKISSCDLRIPGHY